MSIIHVNQIKHHVMRLFSGLIDLSDIHDAPAQQREDFLLTRGLAAYAIHFLSGVSVETAAHAVTDGSNDNGIDAIYFDESNHRLYLVQTKWIKNGSGEPENGEVKKFIGGIHDLFNMDFGRFNAKVQAKQSVIEKALEAPNTRYEIVLAYTGTSALAEPSRRDLDDLKNEMNDTSEVIFATVLNQSGLHSSLVSSVVGEPINLPIGIKEWGHKASPHEAYYG